MILRCQPELFPEAYAEIQRILLHRIDDNVAYHASPRDGIIDIDMDHIPSQMQSQIMIWKLKYGG